MTKKKIVIADGELVETVGPWTLEELDATFEYIRKIVWPEKTRKGGGE